MDEASKSGIISGGVGFLSRALVQLVLFGVMIVATRILSIEAFGSFALASLFLVLARALFYVGPYEYLLKTPDRDDLFGSCFAANLILATGSAILLCGVFGLAPMLFKTPNVGILIALLLPSLFLVAITAWYEAILLRGQHVRLYYLCTLAADCLGAAAAVALLLMDFGVFALVAQTYARLLTLLLVYSLNVRVWPFEKASWAHAKDIVRWSKSRYLAVILNFTSGYGSDLILGLMISPAATGLYRASNRIVSTVTDLFAQPLQKIAQTRISARYARNQDEGGLWLQMLSGVGAIGWAALGTLGLLAPQIVPMVLGEKWAEAAPIVTILCLARSFALLDAVTTSFLACHDQQRAMLRTQIITAALVIVIAWLTAPLGVTIVAAAVGCVTTGMSLTYGRMVMRLSGTNPSQLKALLMTAAPPVLTLLAALIVYNAFATPPKTLSMATFAALAVAATGFCIGAFAVRGRILKAIGSLGGEPETYERGART